MMYRKTQSTVRRREVMCFMPYHSLPYLVNTARYFWLTTVRLHGTVGSVQNGGCLYGTAVQYGGGSVQALLLGSYLFSESRERFFHTFEHALAR